MAKIGTAHVEIKPVLNEEALEAIVKRIEENVERAVQGSKPSLTLARCVYIDKQGLIVNGVRFPYYLADEPITIVRHDEISLVNLTIIAEHAQHVEDPAETAQRRISSVDGIER